MASIVPPGRLVYGMQLQVQSQSRMYAEAWEAGAGRDELAAIARKADETGFFYIAVCDHVAIPKPLDERMNTVWYDTVATLGWLAGITANVLLLAHVFVVVYRHPLVTAKSFMTLDELSGGRAILGVGTGHVEPEFELLGVDFTARGRLTDDAIDEIRAAFTDEYVHDAGMRPRPRQSPLPIWVGGSSKPALRRAAERGDGWLPQGTPRAQMPESIAYLREHRERTLGDEPIDIGAITEVLYVGEPGWEVGRHVLSGKPDHIAERLRELGAMGVNHVQVRFRNRSLQELLDQMDAFGTEVAPLLDP
jgi:probable F420-dependent oxidoreductase